MTESTYMSVWYGNCRGGRGGRGSFSGKGRGRYTPIKCQVKKTVQNYFFCMRTKNQSSEYEITTEFVVNHIKKTFDQGSDVSEALQTLVKADTDIWKTTLEIGYYINTNIKK